MGLTDIASSRERLKLITLEYSIESKGHFRDEPIVELFCRDEHGQRRIVEVEGFYPFFYVEQDAFFDKADDLLNDSRIRHFEVHEPMLNDRLRRNSAVVGTEHVPRTNLEGLPLVKIVCGKPSDVKNVREVFDKTYEADVFFTNRFLIESEIFRGLSVPHGKKRISFEEVEALPEEKCPDIAPRMHTVDIEVWSGGEFPDTTNPTKPITAITAHDTYDDEYFCGVLHPDAVVEGAPHSWDDELDWKFPDGVTADQIEVQVYHDENQLLGDYFNWTSARDPDLMTGWNSSRNDIGSGFDYPYLINRAQRINERSVAGLTYGNGRIFVTNRGSPVVGGREMFDMLQAYKKTQIHEKRSYALGYIAEQELGYGKEDVADLDEGWLHEPVEFMEYNIRDTQAVVQIEAAQEVLELYDNIRSVAGCAYTEAADSNIGIIDVLFLRQGKARGLALPTSTKPERGWYYGAKVFNPSPGKHKNVVYPDLASLYPYLMWSLNVSPETIFESLEAAKDAGYERSELYRGHIDYRDDDVKRDSLPDTTEVYYVKPDVKEGFVRSVVDDMVDMKYEYKGAGKKYDAVKRITNSLYGVFGDSNSYGKGFRLFDWRLAETITIAGRMVLQHTADEFTNQLHTMGYHDAELIGGDTDSVMTTIPSAKDRDDALDASFTAADAVNASYDEFMCDSFDICDPAGHKMEVEIESYADAIFFLRDMDSDNPDDGVKKKYSQLVTWDEGTVYDNPSPKTKGFKLVRSDTASITGDVQTEVLHRILLEEEPKESVRTYLKDVWKRANDGEIPLDELGIPSSISSDPMDYGWSISEVEEDEAPMEIGGETLEQGEEYIKYFTPQPNIRGARYATAYVKGEDISSGAKPLMFYVSRVQPNGDLPETYDYGELFSLNAPTDKPDANKREMKEVGRGVDAIALEDVRHLPDEIEVDHEKMSEKTIKDAVSNIVATMGWDFDDLVSDSSQGSLADYM